jgi:parafibromin
VDYFVTECSITVGSAAGGTPPGTPPRTHASLPAGSSQKAKAAASGGDNASPVKRRYVPDATDVEVVKRIKENEIELRDRHTALRGVKLNVSTKIVFLTNSD